jgi:ribosomal protein S18 acetylase RimI-like enzyme
MVMPMIVRPLQSTDLNAVADRVRDRLAEDARRNPFVNPDFHIDDFRAALLNATDLTWVAEGDGRIVGHLFGALLESHGLGAWVGPDGVSFDSDEILFALYDEASRSWTAHGAVEHFAWVFDAKGDARPWFDLGFTTESRRGVIDLATVPDMAFPGGYSLRRGHVGDLELAVALDRVIDEAQSAAPYLSPDVANSVIEDEWRELLEDEEVYYYVVEFEGQGVAQCMTYPLDLRRGSFDHTVHLSAVAVQREHRHRAVGRAMVAGALRDAQRTGFRYAEVNWRVANQRADEFWTRFGFQPTYVRLRRASGGQLTQRRLDGDA